MPASPNARTKRLANIVGLAVALVATAASAATFWWTPAGSDSDPWWAMLLAPSFLGMVLVGGVHGGAPAWLLFGAASGSNGVVWGLLARMIARILGRPRDPDPSAWTE